MKTFRNVLEKVLWRLCLLVLGLTHQSPASAQQFTAGKRKTDLNECHVVIEAVYLRLQRRLARPLVAGPILQQSSSLFGRKLACGSTRSSQEQDFQNGILT